MHYPAYELSYQNNCRLFDICPCSLIRRTCLQGVGAIPTEGKTIFHFYEGKDQCTKTRHSFARNAARSSCSPPASRNSTQRRASRMSPCAPRIPAPLAKTPPRLTESTSPLPALLAALRRKCPSSPERTDPFIAANALQNRKNRAFNLV